MSGSRLLGPDGTQSCDPVNRWQQPGLVTKMSFDLVKRWLQQLYSNGTAA